MEYLGNDIEYSLFFPDFDDTLSIKNVLSRTKNKFELSINYNKEIEFITSNFPQIYKRSPKIVTHFNECIIECILRSQSLRIPNEDYLFNSIVKLSKTSKQYLFLFECVLFINVSHNLIEDFLKVFDINYMNVKIGMQLFPLLSSELKHESILLFQKQNQDILLQRYMINSIVQYLKAENNGDKILDRDLSVSGSSYDEDCEPENVLYDNNRYFQSQSYSENGWITFNFHDRKIFLSEYTLSSYSCNAGNGMHIKSWVLEGSINNDDYTQIDMQIDCDKLNGYNCTATFEVKQEEPFQYIRIRSIDENWNETPNLPLRKVDFAGCFVYNDNWLLGLNEYDSFLSFKSKS